MANTFLALPVPVSSGVGADVDVSLFGAEKTFVTEGLSNGVLIVEGSQDGVNFAPLISLSLFQDPEAAKIHSVQSRMRVRRLSGYGAVTITMGAEVTASNLFGTLVVPGGAGAGPVLNTTTFGPDKTLNVVGNYTPEIVLEGSNDLAEWDPVVTLNTLGPEAISFSGVYAGMRLRRVGSGGGTPSISLGAGPGAAGGGTGPQGVQGAQGFQGSQGNQGVAGSGAQGSQGFQGNQGDTGSQGSQGFQGTLGSQGFQGNAGAQGFQGDAGAQGFQGDTGAQGFQGNIGAQGFQGDAGAQGVQGFQGFQGLQGFQGFQGFQGTPNVATWTGTRFFALDDIGGSDANAGFSDVSTVLAGAAAKKTWAGPTGLASIIPAIGAGRSAEIIIRTKAAGATYLEDFDVRPDLTYGNFIIRATDTNTTAGSVAFSGSANEEIFEGAVTAAGLNAAGYKFTRDTGTIVGATNANPIVVTLSAAPAVAIATGDCITISGANDGSGSGDAGINFMSVVVGAIIDPTNFELADTDGTTYPSMATCGGSYVRYKVTKADLSAASLPITGFVVRGCRFRGDVANTTVANQNRTGHIVDNGTDTVVPNANIGTISPGGDTWYLEEPGVTFQRVMVDMPGGVIPQRSDGVTGGFRMCGIRTPSTSVFQIQGNPLRTNLTFCYAVGSNAISGGGAVVQNCGTLRSSPTFSTTGGSRAVGGTMKFGGTVANISNVNELNLDAAALLSMGGGITNVPRLLISGRSVLASQVAFPLVGCGIASSNTDLGLSSSPGVFVTDSVFFAGISSQQSCGYLRNVQIGFVVGGQASACVTMSGIGSNWAVSKIYDRRGVAGGLSTGFASIGSDNKLLLLDRTVYARAAATGFSKGAEIFSVGATGGGATGYRWYIRDLELANALDPNGNEAKYLSLTLTTGTDPTRDPQSVRVNASSAFVNENLVDIPRWSICKVASGSALKMAKADSFANAKGQLIVAASGAIATTSPVPMSGVGSGWVWLISDDVPVVDDPIYLSTTTDGHVQAALPVLSGTNQKRTVGLAARAIVWNGNNYALTDFDPDRFPTDAEPSAFKFSGLHTTAGAGTATSYLADSGSELTLIPLNSPQNYPSPPRTYRNLRVVAATNPLAANMAITVYKNGVATALTVTILAGSTTVVMNTTDTAVFAAGDLLDLRVDSTAVAVLTAFLSATLEF